MNVDQISTIEEYAEELKKVSGKVFVNEWNRHMAGTEWPEPVVAFNTGANKDSIKHFVDGIGDLNPLFRNREYAKKTKYNCIIAPPTYLYSIVYGHYPDPPPPKSFSIPLYGGDSFECYNPICEGDEIDWKTTFPTRLEIKKNKEGKSVLFIYGTIEFFRNKGGIPLARQNFWVIVVKSWEAPDKEGNVKPVYSAEEIQEIYRIQDNEEIRGSKPRYWEDVQINEELNPIVRGPLTAMDGVAWIKGGVGEFYFCSSRMYRFINKATGWGDYDPDLKVFLNFHEHSATLAGFGSLKSAYIGMFLTNWMGDDGFIWKMKTTQMRGGGNIGDIFWCKGKVKNKYEDQGRYCVDIDCWLENQRREILTPGSATIILPSRNNVNIKYPSPTI